MVNRENNKTLRCYSFLHVSRTVESHDPFALDSSSVDARPAEASIPSSGPHYGDNSDWWSQEHPVNLDNIEPKEREVSGSNFQILDITLNEQMLDNATRRLGRVETVQRGDASTGRLQACCVSADPNDKIYLIFEQDESAIPSTSLRPVGLGTVKTYVRHQNLFRGLWQQNRAFIWAYRLRK